MPRAETSIAIHRSSQAVFDLLHDYDRRLEWDTLLRKAQLVGGATRAARGVRSLCAGKWRVGGIAMETEYIAFDAGRRAAVALTNDPPFFRSFAATILHEPLGDEACKTTYIYNFRAKPGWLAWLLEPIMNLVLARETQVRLRSLKRFVEKAPVAFGDVGPSSAT